MKNFDYATFQLAAKKASKEKPDESTDTAPLEQDHGTDEQVNQSVLPVQDIPSEDTPAPEDVSESVPDAPVAHDIKSDSDLTAFKDDFDTDVTDVSIVEIEPVAIELPKQNVLNDVSDTPDTQNDDSETEQDANEAFARPDVYALRSKKQKENDEYEKSHLRAVPASLVQKARALFPAATNNDEAVSAYIYMKEGCPSDLDVPERFKIVAKSYIGDVVTNEDVQDTLIKELNRMRASDRYLLQKVNAIEMAAAYIVFDRCGFRKDNVSTIDKVNFTESGMRELLDHLETTSVNYQTRIANSEGRQKK